LKNEGAIAASFSAGARASTNILSLEERRFERGFAVATSATSPPTTDALAQKKNAIGWFTWRLAHWAYFLGPKKT
jgi:hypothetical protein